MPFTVELEGFEELDARLRKLEERDPIPLMEGIIDIIREDVAKRFASSPTTSSGGLVYGGAYWRALREGYLRSRPDRVLGQVLIDSGALRDSLTIPGAPHSIVDYGGGIIEFGTDIEYADELNRTWSILFFHDGLMEKIVRWIVQYYTEGKERPDEF